VADDRRSESRDVKKDGEFIRVVNLCTLLLFIVMP